MTQSASPLAAFHLLGDRTRLDPVEAGLRDLRPALFGAYHDLSRIRYDFPLVLVSESPDGSWIKSLTDIFDGLLREIAVAGSDGEEARRQVLALEQTIRSLLASGQKGALSRLWEAAKRRLAGADGATEPGSSAHALNMTLLRARDALDLDGEIVDCDADLAKKLVTRAWQESERLKADQLRTRVARLAQKLSDILKVDYMHSPGAGQPGQLEKAMASGNQAVFDFQAMADILRSKPVGAPLPQSRQRRIRAAISVLQSQHFVALPEKQTASVNSVYRFSFEDCQEALAAFRERLAQMADLVMAISIAELEIENRYDERRHDGIFEQFNQSRLGPGDLEMFPSYLVCIKDVNAAGQTAIFEILRAGLPFKIVAQTNDILDDASLAGGQLSFGTRGQQLAHMAMGLNNVFVMQATSSSLFHLRGFVMKGLASDRPALFSVFSAPSYLGAAAATESRAFPGFVYNPSNGPDLASRFDLPGNPQATNAWPVHQLRYEDTEHNGKVEESVFTLIDFIAADPRYTSHFACVPRHDWSREMMPAAEFLAMDVSNRLDKVPYVLLIDGDNILHRAVYDDRLNDAARRCRNVWHGLQELGGINNSHAVAALVEAQQAWDKEKEELTAQTAAPPRGSGAPTVPHPPTTGPVQKPDPAVQTSPQQVPAAIEESAPTSDDPWIETIRCTTCNECTQLNDRLFSYNEDMRAYIADPDAGTFRELVEAAETCQVAIIHPGKPRNPDEPGLEELIVRAEPFNV